MDGKHKLLGTVSVPEDKKEELNGYVLKLMYMCGIRKTEKVNLAGDEVTVVSLPRPDKNGRVYFDYSIFEKEKKETSFYDMNTCQLVVKEEGYREYLVAMNLVRILLEAYSQETCYLCYEEKPEYTKGYMSVIKGLLGRDFPLPNRAKMWDMLAFFRCELQKEISTSDLMKIYDFSEKDDKQFMTAYIVDLEEEHFMEWATPKVDEKIEKQSSENQSDTEISLKDCLVDSYRSIKHLVEQKQEEVLKEFLKELLSADIMTRKEMAKKEDAYGKLARASLYMLPPVIVRAFSVVIDKDFWEVWQDLQIRGYADVIESKEKEPKKKEEKVVRAFYQVIQRENQDEFVEFGDNQSLELSDEMTSFFSEQSVRMKEMQVTETFEMEKELHRLLHELEKYTDCRLVDQCFITEFMRHAKNPEYQKAILVFQEFMDEKVKFFPEITREQALAWVIRFGKKKQIFMSAFLSLLTTQEQRKRLLGF